MRDRYTFLGNVEIEKSALETLQDNFPFNFQLLKINAYQLMASLKTKLGWLAAVKSTNSRSFEAREPKK